MKVAIIKTGEFETFHEGDLGLEVSLGDVLRTTPLLDLFEGCEVHWYTSPRAAPLAARFPGVTRIHIELTGLDPRAFDLVINLERTAEALRAVAASPRLVGFRPDGSLRDSTGAKWAVEDWKRNQTRQGCPLWQQWLFALLGKTWQGERYRFRRPEGPRLFDYGLNWKVGRKWPGKVMSFPDWQAVAATLERNATVSWQKGFEDLEHYLRWISSCRTIVTHDSLGMHLGIAMGKELIVFFNQANESEVTLYDQGSKILFGARAEPALAEARA